MLLELSEVGYMYKFGAPKFFEKLRLECLKAAAQLWFEVRSLLGIPEYSRRSPVWGSPQTLECLASSMARPLTAAGIMCWRQIKEKYVSLPWDGWKELPNGAISRLKYYEISAWLLSQRWMDVELTSMVQDLQDSDETG
ncbi:hypothetical protein NDU88_002745 [Pleurodeles waltl]|uniref:Uncharacterized protein n=1 Tax=Pleurodeles waltl TaxID=8319 RepID=A0AAV7L4B5_PLEWA|nr:hypothetical protein NDU88_002745 [Pleurodeles waltl]